MQRDHERTVTVHDPTGRLPSYTVIGAADDHGVLGVIERTGGWYEPEVMTFLAGVARPRHPILDVGANVGVLACYLGQLFPASRMYCFEPSPTTRGFLQRNLATFGPRVSIEACGLYDEQRSLVLSNSAHHPGGAFVSTTGVVDPEAVEVPLVRLDDFCADRKIESIGLIKLDIEGSEIRALRGGERVLRRSRPALVAECNPIALRRFQDASHLELLAALRDIYPKVGVLTGAGAVVPITADGLDDVLAARGMCELVAGVPMRSWKRLRHEIRHRRERPAAAPWIQFAYGGQAEVNLIDPPTQATAGAQITIDVTVRNTGSTHWDEVPDHPVRLSYRWIGGDGDGRDGRGVRTNLPRRVAPGERFDTTMTVVVPDDRGVMTLRVCPVQEGFTWFDDLDPASASEAIIDVV